MKALSIINLCAREFNDVGFTRIGRDGTSFTRVPNGPNWLDWLNDAQRTIVLARPDAGSVTEAFQCVAGVRQTLGSSRQRLLDVTSNMGADGATRGKTINLVDFDIKGQTNRDWMTATASTEAREVVYNDKKDPKTFYVSPPIGTRYIEIISSKVPDDIADADVATEDFGLDDLYAGPAQAWMLHRAYAIAINSQGNVQKAWQYFNSFFQQLGIKVRSEMFTGAAVAGAFPAIPSKVID